MSARDNPELRLPEVEKMATTLRIDCGNNIGPAALARFVLIFPVPGKPVQRKMVDAGTPLDRARVVNVVWSRYRSGDPLRRGKGTKKASGEAFTAARDQHGGKFHGWDQPWGEPDGRPGGRGAEGGG